MTKQVLNFFAAGSPRSGRHLGRKSPVSRVAAVAAVMALGSSVLAACGGGGANAQELEPAMAKSWEVTPSRADFALKEGLKCSDGSDLRVMGSNLT